MHSRPLFTCLLAFSSFGSAYKCAPWVSNEECLAKARAFSAELLHPNKTLVVATPNITPAQTFERAAQFTCPPPVKAADCAASASLFSACISKNITASLCFASPNLATANLTTAAPPVVEPTKAAPCTLTQPGSTDVIILDACPPRLPPPQHRPAPAPVAYTAPIADDINFLLPTPTEARMREMETPLGAWTTCVQNNIMNCNNALCTSDTIYAPRCTDHSYPLREGRELCINGLPAICEGFHCVHSEEARRRENMRQGKGGSEWDVEPPSIPIDEGVCKGWEGARAVRAPARTGSSTPAKICVGQGIGKPRENGLGKAESDERVWQNGECYLAEVGS